jgi:hypothetical protein
MVDRSTSSLTVGYDTGFPCDETCKCHPASDLGSTMRVLNSSGPPSAARAFTCSTPVIGRPVGSSSPTWARPTPGVPVDVLTVTRPSRMPITATSGTTTRRFRKPTGLRHDPEPGLGPARGYRQSGSDCPMSCAQGPSLEWDRGARLVSGSPGWLVPCDSPALLPDRTWGPLNVSPVSTGNGPQSSADTWSGGPARSAV